ncbi:MAG: hypothetical protein IPG70_02700 [Moraxellaceae bacterium]|nr:hypothetical protein [Moraxellaceae bacterium]
MSCTEEKIICPKCHIFNCLPKCANTLPPPQANAAQLVQVSQFRTPLFYLEAPLYDPEVKEWIPQKFFKSSTTKH